MDQVQRLAVLCLCAHLLQWFGVVAICMGCLYLLLSCRRNGSVIMSTTSSCKRRTKGGGPGSLKTKTLWVLLVHLSCSQCSVFIITEVVGQYSQCKSRRKISEGSVITAEVFPANWYQILFSREVKCQTNRLIQHSSWLNVCLFTWNLSWNFHVRMILGQTEWKIIPIPTVLSLRFCCFKTSLCREEVTVVLSCFLLF